jgi:hypothetical protein
VPPTTRDITGWNMRPVDRLTDDDHSQLEQLCQRCPDLATIAELAAGQIAHRPGQRRWTLARRCSISLRLD